MNNSTLVFSTCALICLAGCGDDSGKSSGSNNDAGSYTGSFTKDAGIYKPASDAAAGNVTSHTDGGGTSTSLPSVTDCSKAAAGTTCINGAGLVNGQPYTCTATLEDVVRFEIGVPSWAIDCTDDASSTDFGLSFPVQAPGPINLSANRTDQMGLVFNLSTSMSDGDVPVASMTESSTNLTSAQLTGTVVGSTASAITLTGTFTASWSKPDANCMSGDQFGQPVCGEGSMSLTFNIPNAP